VDVINCANFSVDQFRIELFSNILAPSKSTRTRTFCIEILEKKVRRGSGSLCKLNRRGMKQGTTRLTISQRWYKVLEMLECEI